MARGLFVWRGAWRAGISSQGECVLSKRARYTGLAAWLIVGFLLAACGGPGPAARTQTPGPAAATSAGGAASDPPATLMPTAAAPTAGPFGFQVEVGQAGQFFPAGVEPVRLERQPFTLRLRLPAPLPVKLNALDTDDNFLVIQPGFVLSPECLAALCTGMDVAEEKLNPQQLLFVDPLSTHYLYYTGPDDHRWSRATVGPEGAVFERDVAVLMGDPSLPAGTPVDLYPGPALYLLVYVDGFNPGVVDPGELAKVTLQFP
jgi:hypothetical protein